MFTRSAWGGEPEEANQLRTGSRASGPDVPERSVTACVMFDV